GAGRADPEGELGDLYRLWRDVHAIEVVLEDEGRRTLDPVVVAAGAVGIAGLDVAQVVEQAETMVQEPVVGRDQKGSRAAGRVAQGHTVQPGQHRAQEAAAGRSGAAYVNAMLLGQIGACLLPKRIERG